MGTTTERLAALQRELRLASLDVDFAYSNFLDSADQLTKAVDRREAIEAELNAAIAQDFSPLMRSALVTNQEHSV